MPSSTVMAWNVIRIAQLGFEQFGPHHRRRGFPTRVRYLPRSAFLTSCYCSPVPFGRRLDAALATSTPVVLHYRNKRRRTSMAHVFILYAITW
jgi:hypothetical protein